MNALRKKISSVLLRGIQDDPNADYQQLSSDSGYVSASPSVLENKSYKALVIPSVAEPWYVSKLGSLRQKFYKEETIDYEPVSKELQSPAKETQNPRTPKKQKSLTKRIANSLGRSSRRKNRNARSSPGQQESENLTGSPSKLHSTARDVPPIICTSIPSGSLGEAVALEPATETLSRTDTGTGFDPKYLSPDSRLAKISGDPWKPTEAFGIGQGSAKRFHKELAGPQSSIARQNNVEDASSVGKGKPSSTTIQCFIRSEALAFQKAEQADDLKPMTVARFLWPQATRHLAASALAEKILSRDRIGAGSDDDSHSDKQARYLSDDKGYAPDTESDTEDPGSENASPLGTLSRSPITAPASNLPMSPITVADGHSPAQSTSLKPAVQLLDQTMVKQEADIQPLSLNAGDPRAASDLPESGQKSSIQPLTLGESNPGKDVALTSEMYEADGEVSETNIEVPTMGSREEWQRTRADRHRRYLALLTNEDSTDADEDTSSEYNLTRRDAKDDVVCENDFLESPTTREKSDEDLEPSSIVKQAMSIIEIHYASISRMKKQVGSLHYSVEAIERQNGQSIDDSEPTITQWLSAPFPEALEAIQRAQLFHRHSAEKATKKQVLMSEDVDETSNVGFDHLSGPSTVASDTYRSPLAEIRQGCPDLTDVRREVMSTFFDEEKTREQISGAEKPPRSSPPAAHNDDTGNALQVKEIPSTKHQPQFQVQHFQSNEQDPKLCCSSREVGDLAKRERKEVCFAEEVQFINGIQPTGNSGVPSRECEDDGKEKLGASKDRKISSEISKRVGLAKELTQKEVRAFMRLAYKIEEDANKENEVFAHDLR